VTKWNVLFYESEDGICEVEDYLNGRKVSNKAKAFAWIQMLEEHGPHLPRPYADILRDGIHELRIKMSGDQGRVLYFFTFRDIIVLTHPFTKNTSKVPTEEIEKAVRIRNEFVRRFPKREALNEILKKSPPRRTAKQ
jgi:phage-related protein